MILTRGQRHSRFILPVSAAILIALSGCITGGMLMAKWAIYPGSALQSYSLPYTKHDCQDLVWQDGHKSRQCGWVLISDILLSTRDHSDRVYGWYDGHHVQIAIGPLEVGITAII